jgi:hypothetical protein
MYHPASMRATEVRITSQVEVDSIRVARAKKKLPKRNSKAGIQAPNSAMAQVRVDSTVRQGDLTCVEGPRTPRRVERRNLRFINELCSADLATTAVEKPCLEWSFGTANLPLAPAQKLPECARKCHFFCDRFRARPCPGLETARSMSASMGMAPANSRQSSLARRVNLAWRAIKDDM